MTRIVSAEALDLRFPTSDTLGGSDAMNPAPDYSAAYVILRTNHDGLEGHGLTFTIGRGNEVCVAAIKALAPFVVDLELEELRENIGGVWRRLVGDSQLRWLGPEKGVIHLAAAALTNALWDLRAKAEGAPVWRLVANMTPEEIVAAIDFRHMTDVLTPEEALDLLRDARRGVDARAATLKRSGYPAYTTAPGWLGYSDDQLRELCRQAVADGWGAVKLKVGRSLDDDRRRLAIAREEIGPERPLMIDANQVWELDEAARWVTALAEFNPGWIEEPLSPDDILGHAALKRRVAPIPVATGEHVHNRVMFKQFLAADAMDVVQLDGCRLGGLNEVLAVLMLAAKFGKPVCPHAGGVGLCEYAQHFSFIDYAVVSGAMDGRMIEHAGEMHEHFLDPIVLRDGRYQAPAAPGFSIAMKPESRAAHRYPDGPVWAARRG